MNILVINGSPKGEKSNTFKITTAFLQGLNKNKTNNIDTINISDMDINHCKGCFTCWTKTPGKCVIRDDMPALIEKYLAADLIIWSFPLYYFGIPSKTKAFLDRMLPINLPFMIERKDGGCEHPNRYDMSGKRYILISTCGFCSIKNNYESLFRQFEILYGKNLSKIICTEGEFLHVPELKERTAQYLSYVKQAGEEYSENFEISHETKEKLTELLCPPKDFIEAVNASWKINETK